MVPTRQEKDNKAIRDRKGQATKCQGQYIIGWECCCIQDRKDSLKSEEGTARNSKKGGDCYCLPIKDYGLS